MNYGKALYVLLCVKRNKAPKGLNDNFGGFLYVDKLFLSLFYNIVFCQSLAASRVQISLDGLEQNNVIKIHFTLHPKYHKGYSKTAYKTTLLSFTNQQVRSDIYILAHKCIFTLGITLRTNLTASTLFSMCTAISRRSTHGFQEERTK